MKTASSWIRDLVLLALLIGAFFACNLGTRALWSPGEGRYAEVAREMIASGDYVTPRLAGMKFLEKPPLFIWLETLSSRYFGVSEWSLRLWPAILALAGCLAIYLAGRNLFGRKAGIISAVVLATSGLWYGCGHIISLDMAVSVFIACTLLTFLFGVREQPGAKRRLWVGASFAFAALATLTKGLIGIVLPGLVIGLWIVLLDEWEILARIYLRSGVFIFLLIAAPWHVLMARANPGFLNYFFIHGQFGRYLTSRDGPLHGPAAFIPVLALGLFPWTVLLVQAIKRNLDFPWKQRREHKEILFIFLWAAVVFLFFSLSSYQDIPYILPMFPPLALLIGRYLATCWYQRNSRDNAFACKSLFVAMVVMALVSLSAPQHYLERYSNWPSLGEPSEEGRIVSNTRSEYGELAALQNYLYLQAAVLAAGALAILLLAKRRGFGWAFTAASVSWALFLLIMNNSLSVIDERRSVKDLATVIRSEIKPGDELAVYHNYYQDLPVYLQRPVKIVGWSGELQFGRRFKGDASPWIVDDQAFWKDWNQPQTVFTVTDRKTFEQLRQRHPGNFHIVAETPYDIVLANRATETVAVTGLHRTAPGLWGDLLSRFRPERLTVIRRIFGRARALL